MGEKDAPALRALFFLLFCGCLFLGRLLDATTAGCLPPFCAPPLLLAPESCCFTPGKRKRLPPLDPPALPPLPRLGPNGSLSRSLSILQRMRRTHDGIGRKRQQRSRESGREVQERMRVIWGSCLSSAGSVGRRRTTQASGRSGPGRRRPRLR